MKQIRTLKPDEIEVRVGTIKDTGISLLLYKDARCDMNILDETFGIMGWKRKHEMIDRALFCTVSIRDENGEWVSKQDVGVQSYAEPTKGMASDAFKRACFNIGIGRELYTAPLIWIPIERVYVIKEDGKLKVKDTFHVSYISYDDEGKVIQTLEICNQHNIKRIHTIHGFIDRYFIRSCADNPCIDKSPCTETCDNDRADRSHGSEESFGVKLRIFAEFLITV